jgi:hypothetical protein
MDGQPYVEVSVDLAAGVRTSLFCVFATHTTAGREQIGVNRSDNNRVLGPLLDQPDAGGQTLNLESKLRVLFWAGCWSDRLRGGMWRLLRTIVGSFLLVAGATILVLVGIESGNSLQVCVFAVWSAVVDCPDRSIARTHCGRG